MKKFFLTREVKIGIVAAVTLFIVYFGLNFLKGVDIFTSTNNYYGTYDNIGGLVTSAPVYIKGYKVGQVAEINHNFLSTPAFCVRIAIDKSVKLPIGTEMTLADDGIMGGKIVDLIFPETIQSQFYTSQDTLSTGIALELFDELSAFIPQVGSILNNLDSILCTVQTLTKGEELNNVLKSFDKTTAELAVSSTYLKNILRADVPILLDNVNDVLVDLGSVSNNLKQVNFAATLKTLDTTLAELRTFTSKLNSTDGSLGMLMNDQDLYINLSNTASSADKLLIDLQRNPKRYVHFSLFGGKKTE